MLRSTKGLKGFTLIELLIVIAIILILIAIALPNFLEAQIRARITKASSEMKTLVTATESYRIDWGKEPIAMVPASWDQSTYEADGGQGLSWWGFASYNLTTPNQYLTEIPISPFYDAIFFDNHDDLPEEDQFPIIKGEYPYTFVRDLSPLAMLASGQPVGSNNPDITAKAGGPVILDEWFKQQACHSGYLYYSAGPDGFDSTVWFAPASYSPTNGTKSFGDIFIFGPGTPYDDIKDTFLPEGEGIPGREYYLRKAKANCSGDPTNW